ncbi:phage tail protein [Candidatus Dependentiae bacterium]|nr:MAG: phage tail protein [Candidatus Dependentiae bacterium]
MAGPNVQAESIHYLPKNRFRIRVDGESYGEFVTAGPINESEFGVMEINTGEQNGVAAQSAGKKKWSPLVLTQGATRDTKLSDWYDLIGNPDGINGEVDPKYKKTMELDQLDRDGNAVMTWVYTEAWPSKFSEGDFDGNANEFRIVSVTITFKRSRKKIVA